MFVGNITADLCRIGRNYRSVSGVTKTGKITGLALWSLLIVFAIALLLSVLYFIHGSLEMFPTEEQHDKARMTASFCILFLVALEASVAAGLMIKHRKKH
jgi:hypothetical protein